MRRFLIGQLLALALLFHSSLGYSQGLMTLGAGSVRTAQAVVAGYTGPGDVVSGATEYWGLRAYNVAYATGTNPAAIVCDAATFTTCTTINILSNGNFDTAIASGSASCATACVVKQLYGQVAGNNATCSSAATCPTLTFNCLGAHPCLTFTSANSQVLTFSIITTPSTGGVSITSVLGRTGTSLGIIFGGGGVAALGSNAANTGITQWVSGTVSATQSDNAIHAVQAINNGASPASILNVDGTPTTGSSTYGTVGLTTIGSGSGVFYNGKFEELGLYVSTNFSGTQQTSMCHNEFSYWGTATSC